MTEQAIFLNALDLNAVERAAYLDQVCAGDANLRRQVDELLTAHERSGEFLDEPAVAQIAAQTPPAQQNTRTFTADSNSTPDDRTSVTYESASEESLAFLNPPTRPGALGRLDHYEFLETLLRVPARCLGTGVRTARGRRGADAAESVKWRVNAQDA